MGRGFKGKRFRDKRGRGGGGGRGGGWNGDDSRKRTKLDTARYVDESMMMSRR